MAMDGTSTSTVLRVECHAGISGDMLASALHALLESTGRDAGALLDIPATISARSPPVKAIDATFVKTRKGGFAATYLDMRIDEDTGHHGTGVEAIRQALRDCQDASGLAGTRAGDYASRVLDLLVDAESAVHGIQSSGHGHQLHLHELASADTLVDILMVARALDMLGCFRDWGPVVHATPVATGSGTVPTAHGIVPVPAPGTLSILQRAGIPFVEGPVAGEELATPTGVALLACMRPSFTGPDMPSRVVATGVGTGTKTFPGVANILRVSLLEPVAPAGTGAGVPGLASLVQARTGLTCAAGKVFQVRLVVDDASMEEIGYLVEKSFVLGARDAFTSPVHMKKSRTGTEVTVLCDVDILPALVATWLGEGTSTGCRVEEVDRIELARAIDTVQVSLERGDRTFRGPVRVKRVVPVVPGSTGVALSRPSRKIEHDDVVAVATALGVSYHEARLLIEATLGDPRAI